MTKRKLIFSAIAVSMLSSFAAADENKIPQPFRGDSAGSVYSVAYDDLDMLLDHFVYDVGMSNREKAPQGEAPIGTRIKERFSRNTVLEGNRFYFESLKEHETIQLLTAIKEDLQSVPSELALANFSRDEQLAYWLNLYNVTMLESIGKNMPVANMHDLLSPDSDNYILDDEVLNVAGVSLSLNDIKYNILLEKYETPAVIYGMFQGNIGGPSILPRAFTAKNVNSSLNYLADEFINSNRGTGKNGKVSELYSRDSVFFNNDEQVLRNHLAKYIDSEFSQEIAQADELSYSTVDWQFAGLTINARDYNGSASTNTAALLDATYGIGFQDQSLLSAASLPGKMRLSSVRTEILRKLRTNHEVARGSVEVTDLEE